MIKQYHLSCDVPSVCIRYKQDTSPSYQTPEINIAPQKNYPSTSLFILLGDWTLLLPIWIVLGIFDFALASFLLKPILKLKPLKNAWISKLFINLWFTFSITFSLSSAEVVDKLSVILILMNIVLIFILDKIENTDKNTRRKLYVIYFFVFTMLVTTLAIVVYNYSFKEYAYSAIPYVSLISCAYFSPLILFALIVNYKLTYPNKEK